MNKMPPLCKGRWQNESFDGGIEHLLTTTKLDNPSVLNTLDALGYRHIYGYICFGKAKTPFLFFLIYYL